MPCSIESGILLGVLTERATVGELVRPIHDRMPVILRPEDQEQWLDVSRTAFGKAPSLLKPYPAELMDAHDVSTVVNSARYDGPECIKPVLEEQPASSQLSLV